MSLNKIRRIAEITEEHIQRLEAAGLSEHVLSIQREYVCHIKEALKVHDELVKSLNSIDKHGITVEEATHEELVEFIAEIKQITNDALVFVEERFPV